jgi:transposase
MPISKPPYREGFRQEAVDLLLSSGRPLTRVAEELGVSDNSLRIWRNLALSQGRAAQTATAKSSRRSGAPVADPAREIRRLQQENDYLRRQRDILKRALSILGEGPQTGMH